MARKPLHLDMDRKVDGFLALEVALFTLLKIIPRGTMP
jgi:hypothetical protein